MTLRQIYKIEEYINDIQKLIKDKNLNGTSYREEAQLLDKKIKSAINTYNANHIDWNFLEPSDAWELADFNQKVTNNLVVMEASLQGILDSLSYYGTISKIRELIEDGKNVTDFAYSNNIELETECQNYVRRVLSLYEEAFGEKTYEYLTGKSFEKSSQNLNIVIETLSSYMEKIIEKAENSNGLARIEKEEKIIPQTVNNIEVHATATAKNETNVNLTVQFEETREKIKQECLSEEQENAILEKITELELIAKEKNKKTKWENIKGFFSWMATQGLQIAQWIVPLVNTVLSNQ